ncbi:prostaglandin E2 receptor EP4 subtype-like [Oncorhynchus kisutch]|uniref:Prostaglandin E receptor 4 (subtype EP4) c n=1 Tax=Oncorhynchus kisutch TaxID=8019 RepID=A0A8C7GN08_ONCKI|nr:prostaglandin E2 receptor EP4 subtype-like [Oncorhynchus kisutch]
MNNSVYGDGSNISELVQPLCVSHNQSTFPPLRLESKSLVTSATMFAFGVMGNLIAIVVLCISKKEQKETTFYTLVVGMAITDLLGTCFTSPVVIATYIAQRWPGGELLCDFFSFSMLFFGSAGMSILCAMAVERYLAINHAYLYSQYIDRTTARLALMGIYLANIVLCIMPSFGFGKHVRHFPGTWCFLDWRATDPLAASYSFLYGGFMLVLIAVTVLCNFAVCRSLVGMSQKTRIVRAKVSAQVGSRRVFLPSVTCPSAAEIQMFWLLIFMTIVFLVCSIPLVVRIFVNQLYGPSNICAGVNPDYRSDLMAIRFASFNPILDPWVYILCRKNLLVKGCERVKKTVGQVKAGRGRNLGWVGTSNHHSLPSFEHSNETSYASLRTTNYRNDSENQVTTKNKSFTDFTMRQAWDLDTAQANFHPFSVDQTTVIGFEAEIAVVSKPAMIASQLGSSEALPEMCSPAGLHSHVSKVDIVTCTFSTLSSCQSEKCL